MKEKKTKLRRKCQQYVSRKVPTVGNSVPLKAYGVGTKKKNRCVFTTNQKSVLPERGKKQNKKKVLQFATVVITYYYSFRFVFGKCAFFLSVLPIVVLRLRHGPAYFIQNSTHKRYGDGVAPRRSLKKSPFGTRARLDRGGNAFGPPDLT